MKRSKVFLGVTTALLAIAGVAAARTWNHVKVVGYYTGSSNKFCTASAGSFYTINSKSGTKIATNGSSKQLYSQKSTTGLCSSSKLYTKAAD